MFDDLGIFYTDFGSTCLRAGGPTFVGIMDVSTDELFGAAAPRRTLRYPAQTPAVLEGDILTIGGVAYRIAEDPQPIDAGGEMRAVLVSA